MPTTCTIKGKVKDAALGTPVRNAMVKIVGGSPFGKTAMTNSAVNYKITGVTPGRVLIEASLCYQPEEKDKTVSSNTTIDFSLTK